MFFPQVPPEVIRASVFIGTRLAMKPLGGQVAFHMPREIGLVLEHLRLSLRRTDFTWPGLAPVDTLHMRVECALGAVCFVAPRGRARVWAWSVVVSDGCHLSMQSVIL